jgi:transposase
MRTGRPIPPLKITAAEREMLDRWAHGHDRRLAARASAILAAADGVSNKDVAARCAMTKQTVGKWRARFRASRLQGLYDEPRPGAPRRITDEQVARVIRLSGERTPNGSPWTTRSMAQAMGLTQTAISRIWRTHGVRPPPGNGVGREAASAGAGPQPDGQPDGHATSPDGDGARARTLAAMQNLLRNARALRRTCPAELDPLLALAVDAIEGALVRQREPVRSSYARAETALRNARNLLTQAEAAAHNVERSLADKQAATSAAVSAIRNVADGLRDRVAAVPAPRRCPSCGTRYTLRFAVRGMGGEVVTARLPCPRPRCGKPVQVQVPRNAERLRLEEATIS